MVTNVAFLEVLKVEDLMTKCFLGAFLLWFAETALLNTECDARLL